MENKIKMKRVGVVRIFEIFGNLTGAFASRGSDAMRQSLAKVERKHLLFNVQQMTDIDEVGVDAMLSNTKKAAKSGLLIGGCPVVNRIRKRDSERLLSILETQEEAANFFSKELAVQTAEEQFHPERRQFIRLKTILPLRFICEMGDGQSFEFFAVVTNLSEGGLFAEFIESLSEEGVKRNLDPYDLRLIKLSVGLRQDRPLKARGKLIHGNITQGGIGVEFYDMEDNDRSRLRDWIAEHIVKHSQDTMGE